MPGMEGGGNAKAMPSGLPASCCCKLALDVLRAARSLRLARFPRLEIDEEESGIGALHLRKQREVVDGDDAFDAGSLQERVGDFLLGGVGALRRGAIRKLQGKEHVALVLGGKKSAGQAAAEITRPTHRNQHEAEHGKSGFVNQNARSADEVVGGAPEELVEELESLCRADRVCGLPLWA